MQRTEEFSEKLIKWKGCWDFNTGFDLPPGCNEYKNSYQNISINYAACAQTKMIKYNSRNTNITLTKLFLTWKGKGLAERNCSGISIFPINLPQSRQNTAVPRAKRSLFQHSYLTSDNPYTLTLMNNSNPSP